VDRYWEPELDNETRQWLAVARDLGVNYFGPLAEELDRDERYPWENVKLLVESGLVSLFVPREFGGKELSLTAVCAVAEEVSRACSSTGAILAAYALGAYPILLAGTDEQKSKYLGELMAGDAVSFALTEVGAGSDASAIKTTAIREGDRWHIEGEKIYIGNGGASRYYVVFAKTAAEGSIREGTTAFMVDRESPGVIIDRYESKMGIRGTNTSNLKLDTYVGHGDIVGELGRGMRLAFQTLNVGRITVASQSTGIALAALDAGVAEAARRQTFGASIIDHQGIGFRLADCATATTAARMLTYEAASAFDQGKDVSILGAMAKLFASEAAHDAANTAVQVFGGDGFCKPCIAERLYRDQRVLEIYEGSSEIQRLVISRSLKALANSPEG
jgi:alkylation response protein AidB-like acyl-CoA dehydrogenase